MSTWIKRSAEADWDYQTDLTNDTARRISEQVSIDYANFREKVWKLIQTVDYKSFKSDELKRQLEKLNVIGVAALPEDKLTDYTKIYTEMTEIYSTAKICPYQNQSAI
ncbi:Angiotensin-converting enzyme 2 [Orchesella cincta]|uniref:Angiotensin-converting enzyme 2 n=1 Tax=Orchesella cincta TaxID=48709 RepID=A0A1D2MI89_ORCCI|nr:Angiotensin-converting enzyme 2 [Orchesella cincta]